MPLHKNTRSDVSRSRYCFVQLSTKIASQRPRHPWLQEVRQILWSLVGSDDDDDDDDDDVEANIASSPRRMMRKEEAVTSLTGHPKYEYRMHQLLLFVAMTPNLLRKALALSSRESYQRSPA